MSFLVFLLDSITLLPGRGFILFYNPVYIVRFTYILFLITNVMIYCLYLLDIIVIFTTFIIRKSNVFTIYGHFAIQA